MTGIEPATVGLLDQCSTDWATRAYHVIYIASHHRGQAGIEPAASRTLNENHTTRPLAHIHLKKIFWSAPTRARTGDLSVNSRPLCQLSHGSYDACVMWYIGVWVKKKFGCSHMAYGIRTPHANASKDIYAYLIKRLDHRVTIVTAYITAYISLHNDCILGRVV